MSHYAVRIVGPAGRETYLTRGRETAAFAQATLYSSPSAARKAMNDYYRKIAGQSVYMEAFKSDDPETRFPL